MTRIIIRAVDPASEFVAYLRERLPGAEWAFDETRDAYDTYLKALCMAGDDAVVHMEDDVLLTGGFLPKLQEAISRRPAEVIQFFSMRGADLTVGSRYDRSFLMAQCFYLPSGYSRLILDYGQTWAKRAVERTNLDGMTADWLRSRREPYWIEVPNLVDHRQAVSRIDHRRSKYRQSKTFIGEDRG